MRSEPGQRRPESTPDPPRLPEVEGLLWGAFPLHAGLGRAEATQQGEDHLISKRQTLPAPRRHFQSQARGGVLGPPALQPPHL